MSQLPSDLDVASASIGSTGHVCLTSQDLA